jgi:hypothetical protein
VIEKPPKNVGIEIQKQLRPDMLEEDKEGEVPRISGLQPASTKFVQDFTEPIQSVETASYKVQPNAITNLFSQLKSKHEKREQLRIEKELASDCDSILNTAKPKVVMSARVEPTHLSFSSYPGV